MRRQRLAIFISGTGSNLSAALEMRDTLDVALVVSSRKKALGLLKARRAGVPTLVLSNPISWTDLTKALLNNRIDGIFLLGFMKILPREFLDDWKGKILNLHPSLLPAYPGLQSIERAFEDKASIGASIHHVVPEMDAGPIVIQKKVFNSQGFDVFNSLEETTMEVHRYEQRLVREVLAKWNREAI